MNISAITEASVAIQIHTAAAVLALGLGCLMWARKKGTRSHKIIGRGFIALMIAAAISAIFIRQLAPQGAKNLPSIRSMFVIYSFSPCLFPVLSLSCQGAPCGIFSLACKTHLLRA